MSATIDDSTTNHYDGNEDNDENPSNHDRSNSYSNIDGLMEIGIHLEESKSNDGRSVQEQVHSYLPGVSHPLFPRDFLTRRGSIGLARNKKRDFECFQEGSSASSGDSIHKLAILELDAVSFPGESLPLRLHDRQWIRYLYQKIDQAKQWMVSSQESESTNCQVQIGVIPHVRHPRPHRQISVGSSSDNDSEDFLYISLEERQRSSLQEHSQQGYSSQSEYIGRVGTVVTITDLNEPDEEEEGEMERHENHPRQIIATALCTHRFRILSAIDPGQWNEGPSFLYNVEYINDDNLLLPSYGMKGYSSRHTTSCNQTENNDMVEMRYSHQCNARWISQFSHNHELIYHIAWPNKLVSDCTGLSSSLQDSGRYKVDDHNMNPVEFSFAMAAKLPLSFDERLELLEMCSATERLRFIKQTLSMMKEKQKHVACNRCQNKLGLMNNAFTVRSAGGVTGNYVNEHGVVHQTITIREVNEGSVLCYGEPCEKDSWFPGYSWTIACCSACFSHVGWKFLRVRDEKELIEEYFWGIAGNSVSLLSD